MIPSEFKSKFKNSIQFESKYENVFVDINADSFEYRIFEILETGKLKVRRVVVGRPAKTAKGTKKRDQFGNQLYNSFLSVDDAKMHALTYIGNILELHNKKCSFKLAWKGECGASTSSKYCKEHNSVMCSSCGKKATRECEETMGLVCGAPLCDDCEHTIRSNGSNSGGTLPEGLKGHCKKSEQVYKPWYVE